MTHGSVPPERFKNPRVAVPMATPDLTRPRNPAATGEHPVSRRTALKLTLVGLAGLAIGAGSTPLLRSLASAAPRRYRSLSEPDAALLSDICEQIIPRDEAPGATDTGAVDYIDRQLGGALARYLPAYRRGLDSFRRTCAQVHGQPFQELPPAQKIAVLEAVESGRVPGALWGDPTPQAFFGLVLAHTMQSFYGSPRHGGNRGYASYRMLHLDAPAIVGQNRYPKA